MTEQVEVKTYKESFEKLSSIAKTMREQQDPDIDAIIPQVDEANRAYEVCRQRIQQVKMLLGEKLQSTEKS